MTTKLVIKCEQQKIKQVPHTVLEKITSQIILQNSCKIGLKIHWRRLTILETSNKSLWSNVFWYVKVCIFWKCIQYTIHGDKTQILKKFQNALFFLFWAPTHHSFTFNLWFFYELTHCLFQRSGSGIFHFWLCFIFIKVYFCSTKCMDSLTLKCHLTPSKIKIIEKPHLVLLPDVRFISCNKKF